MAPQPEPPRGRRRRYPAQAPPGPAWVKCPLCAEWLCRLHKQHVSECACPPIEEWAVDPYHSGGPPPPDVRAQRRAARTGRIGEP